VAIAAKQPPGLRALILDAMLYFVDDDVRKKLEADMEKQGFRTDFLRDAEAKG
jgi:hypothetical protein